jgi:hypothetical protein
VSLWSRQGTTYTPFFTSNSCELTVLTLKAERVHKTTYDEAMNSLLVICRTISQTTICGGSARLRRTSEDTCDSTGSDAFRSQLECNRLSDKNTKECIEPYVKRLLGCHPQEMTRHAGELRVTSTDHYDVLSEAQEGRLWRTGSYLSSDQTLPP